MKNLICLLLVFISVSVVAQTPNKIGEVTHLQVFKNPDSDTSYFIVQLDGSIGSNPCVDDGQTWAGTFDSEAEKAQYSALLAAYMSGKSVNLQGTSDEDSSNNCIGSWVRIRNVYSIW